MKINTHTHTFSILLNGYKVTVLTMLYIFFLIIFLYLKFILKKKKQNLNVLHSSVLFISLWLLWVFIALPGLSLVAAGRRRVL